MVWACPYTGLPVAVAVFVFFPRADRQLGMFIGPVPWPSFVQEKEEGEFGPARGGDRRWSQLSRRLIALLTPPRCLQAAPHRGLVSLADPRVSGWSSTVFLPAHGVLVAPFGC